MSTGYFRNLKRRLLLCGVAAMPFGKALAASIDWSTFKARFLKPEGRIVDTGNDGISHTEGQGWGLLFALEAGDETAFSAIASWTQSTLSRFGDAL